MADENLARLIVILIPFLIYIAYKLIQAARKHGKERKKSLRNIAMTLMIIFVFAVIGFIVA